MPLPCGRKKAVGGEPAKRLKAGDVRKQFRRQPGSGTESTGELSTRSRCEQVYLASAIHTLKAVRIVLVNATRLPIPVTRALRKLGHDIRDARRRRIPVAILAQRASISRTTLNKLEKGDPGVSLGACATVLFALGMAGRL